MNVFSFKKCPVLQSCECFYCKVPNILRVETCLCFSVGCELHPGGSLISKWDSRNLHMPPKKTQPPPEVSLGNLCRKLPHNSQTGWCHLQKCCWSQKMQVHQRWMRPFLNRTGEFDGGKAASICSVLQMIRHVHTRLIYLGVYSERELEQICYLTHKSAAQMPNPSQRAAQF